MIHFILKPLIVSISFLIGFFLLENIFIIKLKNKKIYSILVELSYFILFWGVIYVRFL